MKTKTRLYRVGGYIIAALIIIIPITSSILGIIPIVFGMKGTTYQSSGKALEGYDVVSYFRGTPTIGSTTYQCDTNGATWLFYSQENLELFRSNPNAYIPQFGGYCTKAVSTGFTAPSDPTVWKIYNNKLYIFSDKEVKAEFESNPSEIIIKCNEEWL